MFRTGNIVRPFFLLLLISAGCLDQETGQANGTDLTPQTTVYQTTLGVGTLLRDSLHLVANRSVGLITNHTGKDRLGTPTIDLLFDHPEVDLVALYSPEHGIRGTVEAGVEVDSGRDAETGLPVYSLYGATRKPTNEMLEGVEVLLFDIQDVGARYYTYLSTMVFGMEAAGEAQIPFVVLDRPNPIGGTAQGNILDPAYSTFVGLFPVPMRHGLTAGEFARMAVGEFGVDVELSVAPMSEWAPDIRFEDTALPWTAPSPNMPSVTSALHYPGTCLFEGTTMSVGRGTNRAFQQVGAPWLDDEELAQALNNQNLPDTRFEAVRFTPSAPGDGKFDGVEVRGVRLVATGDEYDPTKAALAILVAAKALSGESWGWNIAHFDRLSGTNQLRLGIEADLPLEDLTSDWESGLLAFEGQAAPYSLYR